MNISITVGGTAGRLELPAPLDSLQRQIEAIQVNAQSSAAPSISSVDSEIPGLGWHLQYTRLDNEDTLRKLNRLAEITDSMNAAGHYHLYKALASESRQGLDNVLEAAAHIKPAAMDCYEVIPDIATHEALGKWLVEHDRLEDKVPESLRPYLRYRDIGIGYCSAHEGEFLSGGYTGIRTGAEEQVWAELGLLQLTLVTCNRTFRLSLPASNVRLEQAKRTLDVEDLAQARITAVKCANTSLAGLLPLEAVSVEDANTFAQCLQEMQREDNGVMKLCAALEAEQPDTFTAALNIAMDHDDYELVPEDMDEYGKQVLRRAGADNALIDTIDGYMDFAGLGEDSLLEDGVRRTEYGMVRRLSKPFLSEPEIGQAMM